MKKQKQLLLELDANMQILTASKLKEVDGGFRPFPDPPLPRPWDRIKIIWDGCTRPRPHSGGGGGRMTVR
jgi:hypothetical protein